MVSSRPKNISTGMGEARKFLRIFPTRNAGIKLAMCAIYSGKSEGRGRLHGFLSDVSLHRLNCDRVAKPEGTI